MSKLPKMSKKDIATAVIAVLALALVVVVVLVKTGVINSERTTEPETVIETDIVVVSETNEDGDIEFITMVTKYAVPKVSSNHRYPARPTTTKKPVSTTEGTTEVRYVEQTKYVQVTDANGIPLFNADGTPVTEVVTYTVAENSITKATTAPPKSSGVVVTNSNGEAQTDESGNAVTEVVTYYETTTATTNRFDNTEEATTGILNIETDVTRDDTLAQNIVDQINADREAQGLGALEHTTNLKARARTNSMALALPDIYGDNQVSGAYTLTTTYGGSPVYQIVAAANKDKIASADITKIGVGVVKYNGQYYTTVIFE